MTTIISGDGTITGLTATGISAVQQLPAGSVLQVVSASTTTYTANSTSTYADTTLTATITPKFATSKILALINFGQAQKNASNVGNDLNINLVRNGTQIVQLTQEAFYTGTTLAMNGPLSFQYYDSPASTSALTYKCQFRNNDNNGAAISVQVSSMPSVITLMEIAQ